MAMKTLMDGMTTSPSCRRRRIASRAASVIEQRIRSIGKDDRADLPKERINGFPSIPYTHEPRRMPSVKSTVFKG